MGLNIFSSNTNEYRSLKDIRLRKAELKSEILKDSSKMQTIWNSLVHTPKDNTTPTQRFTNMFTTGANVVDGLMLGWKLYRKFGGHKKIRNNKKGFFGWKKKK